MKLHNYQQDAHDEAIKWVKHSIEPCLIEAPTGAGKSYIIAGISKTIHDISKGKKILCLCPNAELVTQNREKYILTGEPASIYSASAGSKCLKHPVVFGTPGTVKNRISRFGNEFALVIIDECHEITPTIKSIIEAIRTINTNLRVIGLSATPYRLGSGYIYAADETGKPTGEHACKDPYFTRKVFTISAHELIERGFLTHPKIGGINSESYHTLNMELNARGKFNQKDIDRAYHGHGRKTSAVIADIIKQSAGKQGVMVFAATVQHARECMASLPPELSAMVDADTPKQERKDIVKRFKAKKIKYLVNVAVYTKGFDASHVDVVAILRATESVALLQQIVGRGLRVDPGKEFCLVLDYAENVERHCPDGDLFNPTIQAAFKGTEQGNLTALCPSCGVENEFSARPNLEQFDVSESGYFTDLDGNEIPTDHGSMPAHFGRRCQAMYLVKGGKYQQCSYRWTFKECPHCQHDNDIAARYCKSCKGEIIDPNEKLKIEFKQLKRDPTRIQTDKVVSMLCKPTVARSGKECLRVDFTTEYRSFAVWYQKESTWPKQVHAYELFKNATNACKSTPCTVTYVKDANTKFYDVLAFNQQHDEDESE